MNCREVQNKKRLGSSRILVFEPPGGPSSTKLEHFVLSWIYVWPFWSNVWPSCSHRGHISSHLGKSTQNIWPKEHGAWKKNENPFCKLFISIWLQGLRHATVYGCRSHAAACWLLAADWLRQRCFKILNSVKLGRCVSEIYGLYNGQSCTSMVEHWLHRSTSPLSILVRYWRAMWACSPLKNSTQHWPWPPNPLRMASYSSPSASQWTETVSPREKTGSPVNLLRNSESDEYPNEAGRALRTCRHAETALNAMVSVMVTPFEMNSSIVFCPEACANVLPRNPNAWNLLSFK